jgi:CheY-like chemotaxis protein
MNILIVDDDVFFQNIMSYSLSQLSHHVSLAEDGKKAIDLIEKNANIDLIICDINMPVLTGPSFILSIKKFYPKKLPTIVIVSASHDGEAFMKKIEIPHDYYFTKPVDMDAFSKMLEKM